MAPAVDDLVRMRNDDDLVDQHLGQRAPINSRQVLMSDPHFHRMGRWSTG